MVPYAPRGLSAVPELFEQGLVAHGVHALPETFVFPDPQLMVASQTVERVLLKHRVIPVDPIDDRRLANHESAIDPAIVTLGLFLKRCDQISVEGQIPITPGWLNCRHRSKAALGFVKLYRLRDIHVTNTIAIGQAEGFQSDAQPLA